MNKPLQTPGDPTSNNLSGTPPPPKKKRKSQEQRRKEADAKPAPRLTKMSPEMAKAFRQLLREIEDLLGREPNKQEVLDACFHPDGGREYAQAQLRAAYLPPWKTKTNPPSAN